jgi:cytochrome c-type biogenesis protein CcmE
VKKSAKLLIVLLVLLAGTALAFAGAAPAGYKNVSDVVGDPGLVGHEVEVKASVVDGSVHRNATPVTFRIADAQRALDVRWDPAVPLPDQEAGGTIEGKNVVVTGTVERDASTGELYLLASGMQVGCASKYRAA